MREALMPELGRQAGGEQDEREALAVASSGRDPEPRGHRPESIVLVRPVSPTVAEGERSHLDRTPIDLAKARAQHRAYVRELSGLGPRVVALPVAEALPDAVFVEDPIVVLDSCAIALRMGSEARRPELSSIVDAVGRFRHVVRMEDPAATMDGGDVLRIGRDLFVGRSSRTNDAGIESLRRIAEPLGYRVTPAEVHGCLHLKSGCGWAGRHLLIHEGWVDPAPFASLDRLPVPPEEPFGANVLAVAGRVLVSAAHPATERVLRAHGYRTRSLDVSEFEKAEGGLTCMSVRFRAARSADPLAPRDL